MDLAATGSPQLASAKECKERSCINITSSIFLTLRVPNLGLHPGLSFSVWVKADAASVSSARIFDLGNGQPNNNIFMGRLGDADVLQVGVYRDVSTLSTLEVAGEWVTGEWRHITWTIAPTSESAATWSVYANGALKSSKAAAHWPMSVSLTNSRIGSNIGSGDLKFVGLLDSFYIFSAVLTASQVSALVTVSLCRTVCELCTRLFQPLYCLASWCRAHACSLRDSYASSYSITRPVRQRRPSLLFTSLGTCGSSTRKLRASNSHLRASKALRRSRNARTALASAWKTAHFCSFRSTTSERTQA